MTTAPQVELHVGDVSESQLVIGNYNTVQTPKGAKVTVIQAGARPAPTLRALPLRYRPTAQVEAFGRDEELVLAGSASAASPVQLHGGDGIGKTTVLKLVGEKLGPPREGVALESIRRRGLDEVQAKLYSAFWECEVPFLPGPAEIGEFLVDREALLLLDDCELDRDDLEALLDAAPRSTFVIGSETRNLWSRGTARALAGLKTAAGVALLERELGQAIEGAQRKDAEAVIERLEGRPQSLVETAAMILDGRASLPQLARDASALAQRIDIDALTASQRRILALLGAIDGAALGVEHLAALADAPDAGRELADLERRGWVKGQSPRYRLVRALPAGLAPSSAAQMPDRLLDHLARWAREQSTPSAIADEAEAIEEGLALGAAAGRWQAVLSLAAAAGSRLHLAGAWAASGRVLSAGLAAGRALRSEAAEAYFLHQLGSLALWLGESEEAISQLSQALRIRDRLGDREGAELTRHNLGQIGGGPGSDGMGGNGGGGPWRPRLGLTLGLIAALALIVGGVVLASNGGGGATKLTTPPDRTSGGGAGDRTKNGGSTDQGKPREVLITISAPRQDARYDVDEEVDASFTCIDQADGSETPSCTATNDGRTISDGSTINTDRGEHDFIVTAIDRAGHDHVMPVTYFAGTEGTTGPTDGTTGPNGTTVPTQSTQTGGQIY
jgi:hypothetical protein